MSKFISTLEKDIRKDSFTKTEVVVYGILAPLALILIMGLAGWIETAFIQTP